jgi:glycosyltransferase involved in cell wall biosynthesis
MRLLHLYSGNLYGGIESMLLTFARSRRLVPELEHEFALSFEGRLADELSAEGAAVHKLGQIRASRPQTIIAARKEVRKLLAGNRFDAVIGHAAWSYAMLGKPARRAGVPLVFWAHDPAEGRHWTERWARRTVPDLILANSEFTGDTWSRTWPTASSKVIYCPVESRAVTLSEKERAAVRAELSTPADAVVIIQASRIEPWKGHQTLLAALHLMRADTSWHCWIAGGPQRPQEEEYYRGLQTQAAAFGGRVHFLGQRADVARLLAASDIYCQPNLQPEPFGIALAEALYAGLPVVTSEMGGARELVNSECGVLVPPNDATGLMQSLRSLIEDPELRRTLSAAGPQQAARLTDPERQSQLLLRVLADHVHPASTC